MEKRDPSSLFHFVVCLQLPLSLQFNGSSETPLSLFTEAPPFSLLSMDILRDYSSSRPQGNLQISQMSSPSLAHFAGFDVNTCEYSLKFLRSTFFTRIHAHASNVPEESVLECGRNNKDNILPFLKMSNPINSKWNYQQKISSGIYHNHKDPKYPLFSIISSF